MQSSGRSDEDSADDLLRRLLLGADYDELLALKQVLNDPEAFSNKLAPVISKAISLRTRSDQSLAEVLAPSLDAAIKESIAADPAALAESLYPVMGPAIRKSISETLSQMLENMNQLLEQSLSPKSLGSIQ
jgi:OOP family OmpA-OmpF porin